MRLFKLFLRTVCFSIVAFTAVMLLHWVLNRSFEWSEATGFGIASGIGYWIGWKDGRECREPLAHPH